MHIFMNWPPLPLPPFPAHKRTHAHTIVLNLHVHKSAHKHNSKLSASSLCWLQLQAFLHMKIESIIVW